MGIDMLRWIETQVWIVLSRHGGGEAPYLIARSEALSPMPRVWGRRDRTRLPSREADTKMHLATGSIAAER
jgi:hypothetical protein